MCLHVWSGCRYTGSISKQHSRCLWHPRRVFILCHSLICSGFEPFRPEEQLLSAEDEILLLTNLVTPLVNRYMYQMIWSSSVLQLLSESRLHLQLSSVIFAIWLRKIETKKRQKEKEDRADEVEGEKGIWRNYDGCVSAFEPLWWKLSKICAATVDGILI